MEQTIHFFFGNLLIGRKNNNLIDLVINLSVNQSENQSYFRYRRSACSAVARLLSPGTWTRRVRRTTPTRARPWSTTTRTFSLSHSLRPPLIHHYENFYSFSFTMLTSDSPLRELLVFLIHYALLWSTTTRTFTLSPSLCSPLIHHYENF